MSIPRLRTFILVALVAGVSVFTGVMFTLVQNLSDRFGPEVRADLEWRALRGAQELAKTADLGLAVSDSAMVKESFGVYAQSSDVQAIAAVDTTGATVAQHGQFASFATVFAAKPGELVDGGDYLASWAPAAIEGSQIGKVAVVVSTQRMSEAQATLSNVSRTTLIAGVLGVILGAVVILFFTRAVSSRDHQLNDYARNLEQKVEARTAELDERNRGMRLVLDNVAQGFITIDLQGVMASERSAIVDKWFGTPEAESTFGKLVGAQSADLVTSFEMGLEAVRDDFLPLELCLEQMPKRFTVSERTFEVVYSPIMTEQRLEKLLLIVSDVTEHIVRERGEREQRELVALFQRITSDRAGFEEFMTEATGLVTSLDVASDPIVEKRVVHTIKGNCAIYGFERYSELCHEIESELAESTSDELTREQRDRLIAGWQLVVNQIGRLVGERSRNVVEVDFVELSAVIDKAKQGVSSRDLAGVLASWTHEPVACRFERLATHATGLARRLGKGELEVAIRDEGIRLESARWAPFWSSLVHAVRNSIDHGLESEAERIAAGKQPKGGLAFSASRTPTRMTVSIADDGRGIDWEGLRERAAKAGMPAVTREDLVEALFADGITTTSAATTTSGRGVGMASLRDAVKQLGGTISIESHAGTGTTLTFQFATESQALSLRAPTQPLRRNGTTSILPAMR
jgi:HPt (histidine-containing phosphotransfer) domain-containing protein/two-component sensor histidine kinase